MSLTEDQKQEVKHLCRVLGISKLEAIARVVGPAESSSDCDDHNYRDDDRDDDTITLDE